MSEELTTRELLADLRLVAHGLDMVYRSYILRIAATGIGLTVIVGFQANQAIAGVAFVAVLVAWVLGTIMGMRGSSRCLAVPEGSSARNYIRASIAVDAIGLALFISQAIFDTDEGLALVLKGITTFIGLLLFLVFLRHTAELIHDRYLSYRAQAILTNTWLICSGLSFLFVALLVTANGKRIIGLQLISACGVMILIGMALIVFIQYANLLQKLSRSILRRVDAALDYVDYDSERDYDR